MVRKDSQKLAQIGERFIRYLSKRDILQTYAKPELELHFENFKRIEGNVNANYSSMLWVLARISRKLSVRNGYVIFKDAANWNNKYDRIILFFCLV